MRCTGLGLARVPPPFPVLGGPPPPPRGRGGRGSKAAAGEDDNLGKEENGGWVAGGRGGRAALVAVAAAESRRMVDECQGLLAACCWPSVGCPPSPSLPPSLLQRLVVVLVIPTQVLFSADVGLKELVSSQQARAHSVAVHQKPGKLALPVTVEA